MVRWRRRSRCVRSLLWGTAFCVHRVFHDPKIVTKKEVNILTSDSAQSIRLSLCFSSKTNTWSQETPNLILCVSVVSRCLSEAGCFADYGRLATTGPHALMQASKASTWNPCPCCVVRQTGGHHHSISKTHAHPPAVSEGGEFCVLSSLLYICTLDVSLVDYLKTSIAQPCA